MINILEILKKIPNLEDMVFYSPLFNETKVRLHLAEEYKIWIYPKDEMHMGTFISDFGLYMQDYDGEPMLYPSRQNRDWSTFKIPRKDLPKGTNVMISEGDKRWALRKYAGNCKCFSILRKWEYIIPVDKFNFTDWTFNNGDNYGTTYKE